MLHVALVSIQVVIGVAFVAVGDPSCVIRVFFLWATPYAALHFSVRARSPTCPGRAPSSSPRCC
jgi:hypothetical protein